MFAHLIQRADWNGRVRRREGEAGRRRKFGSGTCDGGAGTGTPAARGAMGMMGVGLVRVILFPFIGVALLPRIATGIPRLPILALPIIVVVPAIVAIILPSCVQN